jgi:hypothetical protein
MRPFPQLIALAFQILSAAAKDLPVDQRKTATRSIAELRKAFRRPRVTAVKAEADGAK